MVSFYKKNTCAFIVEIAKVLKPAGDPAIIFWTKIRDFLSEQHKDVSEYKSWTEEEAEEIGTWEELVNKRELLPPVLDNADLYRKNMMTDLIILIYRFIGPLRIQDLYNLEWKPRDGAKTYFEWENDHPTNFVRIEGKTTGTHGSLTHKLKPEQSHQIYEILMHLKLTIPSSTKWIFWHKDDEHISQPSFTKFMQEIFEGKSCDMMRKIFVTQVASKMDEENRSYIEKVMGHTRKTADAVYNKGSHHSEEYEELVQKFDELSEHQVEVTRKIDELSEQYGEILTKLSKLEELISNLITPKIQLQPAVPQIPFTIPTIKF